MNDSRTYSSCQPNQYNFNQSYTMIISMLSFMSALVMTLIMSTLVAF